MSMLERYAEWLERTDIPITDRIAIANGQLTLLEALGKVGLVQSQVSLSQLTALQNTIKYEAGIYQRLGISPVIGNFVIGPVLRWTIEGKPGLWSTQSIIEQFNLRPRLNPNV